MTSIQAIQHQPAFAAARKQATPAFSGQAQAPVALDVAAPKTDTLAMRDALVARQPKFGNIMPHIVQDTPDGRTISSDVFSLNFKNNIVYFNGPIYDQTALIFNSQMKFLTDKILRQRKADGIKNPRDLTPDSPDFDEERDKVTIYMDSYGGDFVSLYSVVDMMERMKNNGIVVSTIARGFVGDEAAIMFAAGTKGYRGITPESFAEVSQPRGMGGRPSVDDDELYLKLSQQTKQRMIDFLTKYSATGKSADDIKRILNRSYEIEAEEMVNEWGWADFIATH